MRVARPAIAMRAPAAGPILLVDDDPEMRAMLRDFLIDGGFRVEEAPDAGELLKLVPRVNPAAIVLDHEMPGDWGLETLPTLRRDWPHIPVIVVTAFGGPRLQAEAIRLGAAGYLDKPFRLSDLLAGAPCGRSRLSDSCPVRCADQRATLGLPRAPRNRITRRRPAARGSAPRPPSPARRGWRPTDVLVDVEHVVGVVPGLDSGQPGVVVAI